MRFIKGTLAIIFILSIFSINAYSSNVISVSELNNGLNVDINSSVQSIDTNIIDGEVYYDLNLDGAFNYCDEIGKPKEYMIIKSLIVPGPDAFSYEYQVSDQVEFFGKLAPVFNKGYDPLNLEINTDEIVKVEYAGIKRGNHIALLKVKAAFYNNLSNSIIIAKRIKINIKYHPEKADHLFEIPGLNDYDVLNKESINRWNVKRPHKHSKMKINDRTLGEVSENWFKVKIDEDGVYQLNASKLSSLGANIPADQVATIKIYGKGGKPLNEDVSDGINNEMTEQEIIVNTKSDGSLDNIIFFAKSTTGFEYTPKGIYHYINHFSNSNYYLLTWGGEPGKRAMEMQPPAGNTVNSPSTYTHRIFEEEELVNPYPFGSGRQFFGRSYFSAPFVNKLENLDRNSELLYRITLAHTSNVNGSFDIFENNNQIGSLSLDDTIYEYTYATRKRSEFVVPASTIASDNRSVLKFDYESSNMAGSTPFFDAYEIHYSRSFFALNNELTFIADTNLVGITEFSINNFSGNQIYGFDITDVENPKLMSNLSSTGGVYRFKTELQQGTGEQFYIASTLKSPDIERTEFRDLRNTQFDADVILITTSELTQSAKAFAEYRSGNSNLSIEIFELNHIYNAFASGVEDVTAVRDFIAHAYHNWNVVPQYVILWGDGHFDYRNIMFKNKNLIPPYESLDDTSVFNETRSYASDDYFVNVEGNPGEWLIDLAIGRITINSDQQGFNILEKIKHYENNSSDDQWRSNVTLIADDSWVGNDPDKNPDGAVHTRQSEILAEYYIPDNMNIEKLYLVEYKSQYLGNTIRKPGVTQDMLSLINNSGSVILNWVGHGNPRVWAHEAILERETTIPEMINWDKLFFLTAATCDYSRFDSPTVNSGAEEMFQSMYGGAIGVFSASRLVFSHENALLNQSFYDGLFRRNSETGSLQTLGEAYYEIKSGNNTANDRKFFLLGDPTMRLLLPQKEIRINTINGIDVSNLEAPIELKALSEVSIEAVILDPLTNEVDESFNGVSIFTMLDGDEYIEMNDEVTGDLFRFSKYGGALNRSSYEVVDGKITASFTIPKDISYSESQGRMFAFASGNDNNFAKGSFRNFKVNGLIASGSSDNDGPEISIFLDTRDFQSGDIVSANPRLIVDLMDETGINTTGLGIGHKIEAWIDDDPISIDLTAHFKTSLTDSRKGTAERNIFDLEPGEHTIKIRAWDIFNNFSVASTNFVINPFEDDYLIYDEFAYPNPFNNYTTLSFNHNIEPPFDTNVKIYTFTGRLVRELDVRSTTIGKSEIRWDARDMYGNLVPKGVYFFAIHVKDGFSQGLNKGIKAIRIE